MIKYAGVLSVPSIMTDDWLKVLSDKMPIYDKNINVSSIRLTLIANNYSEILTTYGLGVDFRTYKDKWIEWLNYNVAKRNINQFELMSINMIDLIDWHSDCSLDSIANSIVGKEIHLYAQPGYMYEVSQHLNVDNSRPNVRPNDINKLLTRIVSQSMFKDISTASKA